MFSDQDPDGFTYDELELIQAINDPPVGPLNFSHDLVWPAYSSLLTDIPHEDLRERSRDLDPYNLQ